MPIPSKSLTRRCFVLRSIVVMHALLIPQIKVSYPDTMNTLHVDVYSVPSLFQYLLCIDSSCVQPWVESIQTVCKPGSVSDLLGRMMAIHLGRPLPDASRDQPGQRAENMPCWDLSPRLPPLFDLAPDGVYHASALTGAAVRSYRTLSPLPAGRSGQAVCFLWHFPWGHPRRALPGTVFPWSPDFPPPAPKGAESGHPTVWINFVRSATGPAGQSSSFITPASRSSVSWSATPSTRLGRK